MERAGSSNATADANSRIGEEKAQSSIQCENEDESDDDSSIGVPLISVAPNEALPAMKEKVERPPDGLQWNDTAIMDCWNVAIKSHDNSETSEWRAPSLINQMDLETFTKWNPKPLSLPVWAVDPFSHSETS